jgi:hypothetical protein
MMVDHRKERERPVPACVMARPIRVRGRIGKGLPRISFKKDRADVPRQVLIPEPSQVLIPEPSQVLIPEPSKD